jgi:hypothetical protein
MTKDSATVVVLAAMFFTVTAAAAYGQGSSLKVEIKTTQSVVKNNQDFGASTKIENVSKQDQILHVSQCWYSAMQWTADNSSVHVRQVFCKKNALMDIRLKPGEANEGVLPVHVSLPARELMTPAAVSFRLGFIFPGDEVLPVGPHATAPPPSAPVRLIWSNVVTVTVTD